MINAMIAIWLRVEEFNKFISTMNTLNSQGTGLLGITEDGKKYLYSNKFKFYTFKPAADSEFLQISIPVVHFTALKLIEADGL